MGTSEGLTAVYSCTYVSLLLCLSPQPSTATDTPARLKHELEEILTLQSEIDAIHKSIQKAKTAMQLSKQTKSSKNLITGLENTQVILKTQVDELYASLNIIGEFPELQGISLTFIRTLLLARDLKMTIRRKAVGSFFEWERLDRAVGGHHLPLGEFTLLFRLYV